MTKRKRTKIGPRDVEVLGALERCPLTVAQLCRLSRTFITPFSDANNLRRRLRSLRQAGLVKSWPYAVASHGQSPRYFKLTRDGYRMLYGIDAAMPKRRFFEEVKPGHHHHTRCLASLLVHLITSGRDAGVSMQRFARENSVKLEANGFVLYPDGVFRIATPAGREFNFVIELDNGTERVQSAKDVESIERKIRGYDAHQSQFSANDDGRYLVLFVTTRSDIRTKHILDLAGLAMENTQRTVFLGCNLDSLLARNPFTDAVFKDHRGLRRTLIPRSTIQTKRKAGNTQSKIVRPNPAAELSPQLK